MHHTGPASLTSDPEQWVGRARAGDMNAWALLYRKYFARVSNTLRHKLHDASLAEEVAQETFEQALTCLPHFQGDSRFSTWLHAIALNRARRHWRYERNTARAHQRLADTAGHDPDRRGNPARATLNAARTRALSEIVAELPEPLRDAFMLRDVEGLSREEMAQRLGTTPGNAAVRATRARSRIRTELQRRGWD